MLDRGYMLAATRKRQAKHGALFDGQAWAENESSDSGWLCRKGVARLLSETENNKESNDKDRKADCQPRSDCIGPLKSAFQLTVPAQAMADAAFVVPTVNSLAKFIAGFLAKIVGVSFAANLGPRPNVTHTAKNCGKSR
ncbi:MAG: hypothetical protein LH479_04540 [Polaromonas sp.]|nr:hypothetical protein [Polaromonas sp.]